MDTSLENDSPIQSRYEGRPTVLISRGGRHFVNLRIEFNELHLWIDGPGMTVSAFRFVTSLDALEGYNATAIRRIVGDLRLIARCGHKTDERVATEIRASSMGPIFELGVGPMGMYTGEVRLATRSGRTFRELLDSAFNAEASSIAANRAYVAGLVPLPVLNPDHSSHSDDGGDADHPGHAAHGA